MIASVYKWLLRIGKISGAIAFLVAAPYAFIQYNQAKEAAQIEETLNLFKLYNSAPFTTYRENVTKALVKYKDKINAASESVDALRDLQFLIIQKEGIENDLLLLFDFFDGVKVCVVYKVCDNDTAIELFKPRALDLYVNFYQYMEAQRGAAAKREFGVGLQAIATSRLGG